MKRDEIIRGEAARHIPEAVLQAHLEVPWALMRGMRNRIVHRYYQVDLELNGTSAKNFKV